MLRACRSRKIHPYTKGDGIAGLRSESLAGEKQRMGVVSSFSETFLRLQRRGKTYKDVFHSPTDFDSASNPQLDIGVIYTYEDHWMARLLHSLRLAAQPLNTRLILVQNGEGSDVSSWRRVFPDTKVVRNRKRLDYAPNLNKILEASTARYVLLLNTDMYFDAPEHCVSKMVKFMERHPDCGIATCRVLHPDGTDAASARRFQTVRTILARRTVLGKMMRQTLDDYFYSERDVRGEWGCDWISGCFMLARRKAIEDVGPFEERFRKYFEDVDMCQRMARAGWRVMYNGGTSCYHFEERASNRVLSVSALKHVYAYFRWLLKWGFAPAGRRSQKSHSRAVPHSPPVARRRVA